MIPWPAITQEPCWKCGSSGHWPENCPRYLTQTELAVRWERAFPDSLDPNPWVEKATQVSA